MAEYGIQKLKMLKLIELLQSEADEYHPLRTTELCAKLEAMGISCDRRTLSRDISCLNQNGYEVSSQMIGHEKAYYIVERTFNIPELRILIDAVQAANFITPKKTEQLIEKLSLQAGKHYAQLLKRNMVCVNSHKHSNESIFYSVNTLEEAITLRHMASFHYFDLNEKHQKIYRHNKQLYQVEPLALIYRDDNYYLLTNSSSSTGIRTFRVDRMDTVSVCDQPISLKAESKLEQVSDFTDRAFKMFAGPLREVTLEFDDDLISAIYDKFGEDTQILRVKDTNSCICTVKVHISPIFWGWLFQFTGKMRMCSPADLMQSYRTLCETASSLIP